MKARLRWLDLETKHSVLVKMCVPSHYDHIKSAKSLDSDDFILEVEAMNFTMTPKQLRHLQCFLDEQMKRYVKSARHMAEEEWMLPILQNVSQRLVEEQKHHH